MVFSGPCVGGTGCEFNNKGTVIGKAHVIAAAACRFREARRMEKLRRNEEVGRQFLGQVGRSAHIWLQCRKQGVQRFAVCAENFRAKQVALVLSSGYHKQPDRAVLAVEEASITGTNSVALELVLRRMRTVLQPS